MKKLLNFSLDLVNGGLSVKNQRTGETTYYNVSNSNDISKLRKEFKKNNQIRDIEISYKEYVDLVDMGILSKDEFVYNFAMSNI